MRCWELIAPSFRQVSEGLAGYFFWFAFKSFWATYGWFQVLLPPLVYFVLLALALFAGVGLVRGLRLNRRGGTAEVLARLRLATLSILVVFLALLVLAWYMATDFQPQGRYLFGALVRCWRCSPSASIDC